MATSKIESTQLSWLNRINYGYGIVGFALISFLATGGAWKSFLIGWAVAVLNLELLKRIGSRIIAFYNGGKLDPFFYFFVVGKFMFWGLVVALFTATTWIQAIPFVLGSLTLIVAGLGVGMREWVYGSTAR